VIAVALLAGPGVVVFWRPSLWLRLFTDDPGILAVGALYFRIVGPTYPVLGASMIAAFAFQGLGRATLPLLVTLVRVAAVLSAAIACTTVFGLGEQAVFMCIAVGNLAGATVLLVLLFRTM
jgi:Na+-driven multidrug efflux pump